MNRPARIKEYISSAYPRLGVNKKREVARLVYEIAKIKKLDYASVFDELRRNNLKDFRKIKQYLLKKRFPLSYSENLNPYLPALQLNEEYRVLPEEEFLYPSSVFYDSAGESSEILKKIKKEYPEAEFVKINSLKDYVAERGFSTATYNKRRSQFFAVKEKYDFVKPCPCTSNSVNCGYNIINMGFGCPYECSYCYLQEYSNTPGIVVPVNTGDFISDLDKKIKSGRRYGTGEFTDSLALDHITGFSEVLVNFFRGREALLELKTKSSNIQNLLKTRPAENVVVAFSLNPQSFIEKNEFYCASLKGRLEAAGACSRAGYGVAFHFDPIVLYPGWEKDYAEVVKMMFNYLSPVDIKWISLGTFRFKRELKKIIENRFPESDILNGELSISFDGKLRYPRDMRIDAYRKMIAEIERESKNPFIYLCMESRSVWNDSGLSRAWGWKNLLS
ncbi:MAG: radical SAM protein [Elusimicrobiota bacterium]